MWMITIIKAGLLFLLFVCAESIRERRKFKMTYYTLENDKMQPGDTEIKIVFLSDLHNQVYGKKNDILLDSIKKEKPDLILVGGDMLVGKEHRIPKPALDFTKQLPKIAPVYYAMGNHEQRIKEDTLKYGTAFQRYKKDLIHAGVHFLENKSVEMDIKNTKIRITGLELAMGTYKKFRKYPLAAEEIEQLAGMADAQCFQILLAHNPIYFQAYKAWGADLVLSGHLHGGIARIPGGRGVITPQAFLFPKYSGEMTTEEGRTIIVSKGLGTHTINIRLFNSPEVVVVHLHSCKNQELPV